MSPAFAKARVTKTTLCDGLAVIVESAVHDNNTLDKNKYYISMGIIADSIDIFTKTNILRKPCLFRTALDIKNVNCCLHLITMHLLN